LRVFRTYENDKKSRENVNLKVKDVSAVREKKTKYIDLRKPT